MCYARFCLGAGPPGEEVTTTYGKAANLIDADNFGKNAVMDNAAYTTSTAEAGDVQMRTVVARDATGYCLTNADLQKLAPLIRDTLSEKYLCVVGSSQSIEANKNIFTKTQHI